MEITMGVASDVGRVRKSNEDATVVGRALAVVADGMGGHVAGEVASGHAVDAFRPLLDEEVLDRDAVLGALDKAQAAILADAREHPARRGMGTTVTGLALVVHDGAPAWLVFNVGDSRVYRLDGGQLTQVTADHSPVAGLLSAGMITPEEARHHPMRHVVSRSLGSDLAVPDTWLLPAATGDLFLLCTDGLSNELDDDRIAELLTANPEAQAAADTLVAAAVEAGGHDNVTVVVARRSGDPATQD